MYVLKVWTNWKASTPEGDVFELGQRTLLAGPNGSGKSRVIEAIELCLTGSVSHYAGRASVKDPKTLWRSCPEGAKSLYIEVTLSNNDVIRWEQARSNGKPEILHNGEKVTEPVAPGVMAVSALRSELFGSSARAEKWLAKVLDLDTDSIYGETRDNLTPPQTLLFDALAAQILDPSDLVTRLKKAGREAAEQAKQATAVVEELEHVVGPIVTDAEIEAADQQRAALDQLAQEYNRAMAEAKAWNANGNELQRLKAEYAALPPVTGVDPKLILAMRQVVLALQATQEAWPANKLCPCCRTEVGTLALTTRLETLKSWVQGNEQTLAQVQRASDLLQAIESMQADYSQGCPPIPLYDAEAHKQAVAHYDDLCRRRVAAQAPGMATSTAEGAADRATNYKACAKALAKVLEKAIASRIGAVEKALAQGYPASLGTPRVQLRPQVAIGIERGGKVGAPSGGEEAALVLALAQALNTGGILVLEDRAFDAQTLTAVMECLSATPAQVIIQTTTGVVAPEGWTGVSFWPPVQYDDTVDNLLHDVVNAFGA